MSMDVREAILARLTVVVGGVAGIKTTFRNVVAGDETQLPSVSVLEGDEEVREDDVPARTSLRRYVVVATPHVLLRVEGNAVGSDLNALRLAIIKAVLSDQDLNALTLNRRNVRYAGIQTSEFAARSMVGAAALLFSFTYVLDTAAL
jgi:hypothetical protein